jgi:hypothetical protein
VRHLLEERRQLGAPLSDRLGSDLPGVGVEQGALTEDEQGPC